MRLMPCITLSASAPLILIDFYFFICCINSLNASILIHTLFLLEQYLLFGISMSIRKWTFVNKWLDICLWSIYIYTVFYFYQSRIFPSIQNLFTWKFKSSYKVLQNIGVDGFKRFIWHSCVENFSFSLKVILEKVTVNKNNITTFDFGTFSQISSLIKISHLICSL